jgi:hypothetical protein
MNKEELLIDYGSRCQSEGNWINFITKEGNNDILIWN